MVDSLVRQKFQVKLDVPAKLDGFWEPGYRYYVLYGGRGSSKSWSVADRLIVAGLSAVEIDGEPRPHRFLCCREIQKSIKDSVKKLLDTRIDKLGLRWFYRSTDTSIIGLNGSEFLFAGLRHNAENVKSIEGITGCWVEEAHTISRNSLTLLTPTVRGYDDAFIIFTFNPRFPDDPVYQDFIEINGRPIVRPDAKVIELNYVDNPWFNKALRRDMEFDKSHNPDIYQHIWLGKLLRDGEALVFGKKQIISDWCEPPNGVEFLFGADFGYANDPSTLNRSWMSEDETTIFIDYEAHGVGVELDDLPAFYDEVPEARNWLIKGDSSRPETISHLNRHGFSVIGATKGPDSVKDGIAFLRSKIIVIHPRCSRTLAEFLTHKFKRHSQTEEILPVTEDKNNHHIDGMRYAYEGAWMPGGFHMGVIN